MGNFDIKFGYNDVMITPCVMSDINSRSECSPFTDGSTMLPIFAAPMNCVVDDKNYRKFIDVGITPIIPRTVDFDRRIELLNETVWVAFSLNEFADVFLSDAFEITQPVNVCIDVANGHMRKLYETTKQAKAKHGNNITIMTGNIANPETFEEMVKMEAGISYIRVGIGSGKGCLSTSNTGVGVGMASLIKDVYEARQKLASSGICGCKIPKIIADGGIRNYSDVIKAVALGADYVMIGSVLSQAIESASVKFCNSEEWSELSATTDLNDLTDLHTENNAWYGKLNGKQIFLGDIRTVFYGMASREGQIAMNGEKTKTSEGRTHTLPVLYTLKGWAENMVDYFRSAMSYTGKRSIFEFKGNVEVNIASESYQKAVNK